MTIEAFTPRSAAPRLSSDASSLPEASLRTSSSSLEACRPRWRYWSRMLVITFCATDTASSALSNVVWMVQSSVVSGVVRSSRTLKTVERGQAMPVSGKLSSATSA
jgi:hypothetical protein